MIEKMKDLQYRHILFIDKKRRKREKKHPTHKKLIKFKQTKQENNKFGDFTWIYVTLCKN